MNMENVTNSLVMNESILLHRQDTLYNNHQALATVYWQNFLYVFIKTIMYLFEEIHSKGQYASNMLLTAV